MILVAIEFDWRKNVSLPCVQLTMRLYFCATVPSKTNWPKGQSVFDVDLKKTSSAMKELRAK